jgi:hypothetical protein
MDPQSNPGERQCSSIERKSQDSDTRPPLLHLPPELLIHICLFVQELKFAPSMAFYHFIATCRHIRNVALSVSELWSSIWCTWDEAWRDLCIHRAGTQPLRIRFNGYRQKSSFSVLQSYLPQSSAIYVEYGEHIPDELWMNAVNQIAPFLRSFEVHAIPNQPFRIDHAFLGGDCSYLTSLRLSRADIALPLFLPHLRMLALKWTTISFASLYQLWCGSPELEELILERLDNCGSQNMPPSCTNVRAVPLPKLKYLSLKDAKEHLWPLLQRLPDPSLRLHVYILPCINGYRWEGSTKGDDAALFLRVRSFHQSHGATAPPNLVTISITNPRDGQEDVEDSNQTLEMGERWVKDYETASSVWWSTPTAIDLKNLSNSDPVFFSTSKVAIGFRGKRLQLNSTYKNLLVALPNLRRLTLHHAYKADSLWDSFGKEDLQALVRWASEYPKRHPSLDSLEFLRSSDNIKVYIDDLLRTGVAKIVTWKP